MSDPAGSQQGKGQPEEGSAWRWWALAVGFAAVALIWWTWPASPPTLAEARASLENTVQQTSALLRAHVFFFLAFVPGVVALSFGFFTARDRHLRLDAAIEAALKKKLRDGRTLHERYPIFADDIKQERGPRLFHLLFSSLFLTLVLLVPAFIADRPRAASGQVEVGPGVGVPYLLPASAPADQPKQPEGAAPRGDKANPAKDEDPAAGAASPNPGDDAAKSGTAGLLYAAFGAYAYLLTLMISRINSDALTERFLANSTIRVAVAMVLGFIAGRTQILGTVPGTPALVMYFLAGLFLSWAMDALRERAKNLFNRNEKGCDRLPLCLIDGLDDGIVDRLAEVGAWDVEHVAYSNPVALARRTLYSFPRVLDWVSQAILISRVRSQIVELRSVGIRDAVDFAVLYGDASSLVDFPAEPIESRRDRAEKLLADLSQKTTFSVESLKLMGRQIYDDVGVNFIWDCGLYDEEPWLEGTLQAAVREAGKQSKPPFMLSVPPRLGQPVWPPFPADGDFGKRLEVAIGERIARLGYAWNGTYGDFAAETGWSGVLSKLFAKVSCGPAPAGARASDGNEKAPGDGGGPNGAGGAGVKNGGDGNGPRPVTPAPAVASPDATRSATPDARADAPPDPDRGTTPGATPSLDLGAAVSASLGAALGAKPAPQGAAGDGPPPTTPPDPTS